MYRDVMSGAGAALVMAAVLMVLGERDFDQVPATDTADLVATLAVVGGATVWLAVRKVDAKKSVCQLLGAVAAGVAIGALVVGLVSVVYDPWAP